VSQRGLAFSVSGALRSAIPTGAISLDLALGDRRSTARADRRGLQSGVLGQDDARLLRVLAQAQRLGGVCAFIDAEHTPGRAPEIAGEIERGVYAAAGIAAEPAGRGRA
jgi:RecA/RadA recombinase